MICDDYSQNDYSLYDVGRISRLDLRLPNLNLPDLPVWYGFISRFWSSTYERV